MATALQAKIESLGVKLREENKSKECELLEKDSEKSTCSKKPLLNLDLATSTRQHRPGEYIEVVCSTMKSLVYNLTCTGFLRYHVSINSCSNIFFFCLLEFLLPYLMTSLSGTDFCGIHVGTNFFQSVLDFIVVYLVKFMIHLIFGHKRV